MKFLQATNRPADIKALTMSQLGTLAQEVREELLSTISHLGGHLASSLGAVELCLAVHYVFDAPEDRLLLDATLQIAPGYIQVMAAVMDRWLSQPKPEAPVDEFAPKTTLAEVGVGGLPDSCYMWRADGPLASMRSIRRQEDGDE